MAGTSQPSPKKGNAWKPARWPTKALGVLESTQDALREIARNCDSIDKQTLAINNNIGLAVDAMRRGNVALVNDIMLDIQQRTATQRHTNATIKGAAESARAALAAARVGEY